MSKQIRTITLPAPAPGTSHELKVHHYGMGNRDKGLGPKVYLQASLHADELPGMMALFYLREKLDKLDTENAITGEIVVVPVANPIGLSQQLHGTLAGRYDFHSGENFNRRYPEIADAVGDRIEKQLGTDPARNIAVIRETAIEVLEETATQSPLTTLRKELMLQAIDADIVLDCHCDFDAIFHMYTTPNQWPACEDLSRQMGSQATLLAEVSGGNPFDEAFSGFWLQLEKRFQKQFPIPPGCLSATLEMRGQADVSGKYGEQDADNLIRFLQRRGIIAGDPGPLPDKKCDATPLDGLDYMRADRAGLIRYHKNPGDLVYKGEIVADILDVIADDTEKAAHPVPARTDGVLMARPIFKLARPGSSIASIAGRESLLHRKGHLLSD